MEQQSGAGPAAQAPVEQQTPTEPTKDEKLWGMLCHLTAIFLGFIGPLIFWLIKREEMPFVDDQGKEALNFQITVAIAMFVSGVLAFVLIGFILMPLVGLADLIFCIMGSVAANKGERYRYPVAIRLIK